MNAFEEVEVLAEVVNRVGHLTLNRPAGLNALTLSMVRTLHRQLQVWEEDPEVVAVVLRAVGDKAFCAGGDIRGLYESFHDKGTLHRDFFREEYALDLYLHTYPKPILALINGIVLGGGMGLAQAADVRIVTENARVGMPEVSIGFFPDVGAGYFLPHLAGELGTYLGVTGNHINAADALFCGLADAYLESGDIPKLDAGLAELDWSDEPSADLDTLLRALTTESLPDAPLQVLKPAIDEHFAQPDVTAIRRSLLEESRSAYEDWARKTVEVIDSRSPTSLSVALEHLRRGKTRSLSECFSQDLTLAFQLTDDGDFMEGIRALIIDKDKNPHWDPSTLDAVSPEWVEHFFRQA